MISWPLFFASFFIGLGVVFLLGPEQKQVFVYPSPHNYQDLLFQDDANQCFQVEMKDTPCPKNPLTVPVQSTSLSDPLVPSSMAT